MTRVVDLFKLIRFFNCLLAAVGVIIGASLTWLRPVYYGAMVSAGAAFFVCAAGNVLNDIRDLEADRINHPNRVLVRGGLSIKTAWSLFALLNLLAILLGLAANQTVLVVIVVALALLTAYSLWLKQIVIIGNVSIALLTGLTFVTGGLAVDSRLTLILPGPLIPALFAFLFHLVREILKDVQDIEGDRAQGLVTLPQLIGISGSILTCLGLFFLVVLMTYWPVLKGWYGRTYEIMVVYLVDLPLLFLLIMIWGNPSPKMLAIGSTGLKVGMVIGLVALIAG